jgi:hypothetical protein
MNQASSWIEFMNAETLLSILLGFGLSAACGFRIFVPLLVMSIASYSGHLTLSEGFEWIGSLSALVTFAVATVLEIAGYYIPWVDHLLDVIATPVSVVAGIVVMASTVTGMSPFLRWALAIIAGGGIAGTFQAVTSLTRLTSTATTAGLGNPLVSTLEAGGSLGLSLLSIVLPILASAVALALLALLYWPGRKLLRKLMPSPDEGPAKP